MCERRGDRIPGSALYRSFCISCGEPIRVVLEDVNRDISCNYCRANQHPGYGSPEGGGEDESPWQQKVIREMEEG